MNLKQFNINLLKVLQKLHVYGPMKCFIFSNLVLLLPNSVLACLIIWKHKTSFVYSYNIWFFIYDKFFKA